MTLQAEQTIEKLMVGGRLLHQLRDFIFQLMDMVALTRHMPLHQRNRTAHRVRHRHLFDGAHCV